MFSPCAAVPQAVFGGGGGGGGEDDGPGTDIRK